MRHVVVRVLLRTAQAALIGAALVRPSAAEDPLTLKDILSRAQSEAETKAVNDLIDKLKGVARPKAPVLGAPSAPASGPPRADEVGAAAPAPRAPEPPVSSPPRGEKDAAVPAPAAPPPVVGAPEAAIEAAAQRRLPSVDLEVYFAYNSAAIEHEAVSQLKTLGQALRDASLADDAFLIAGHTDAKGGSRFNLDLSLRRAEAVRQFLIANFGIDRVKLVARGFGSTHLKNSGDPQSAENRRVQIVNLSKEAPPK